MRNQPTDSTLSRGFVAPRQPLTLPLYTTRDLRSRKLLAAARWRQALRRFYAEYNRILGCWPDDGRAEYLRRTQAEDLLRIAFARRGDLG